MSWGVIPRIKIWLWSNASGDTDTPGHLWIRLGRTGFSLNSCVRTSSVNYNEWVYGFWLICESRHLCLALKLPTHVAPKVGLTLKGIQRWWSNIFQPGRLYLPHSVHMCTSTMCLSVSVCVHISLSMWVCMSLCISACTCMCVALSLCIYDCLSTSYFPNFSRYSILWLYKESSKQ